MPGNPEQLELWEEDRDGNLIPPDDNIQNQNKEPPLQPTQIPPQDQADLSIQLNLFPDKGNGHTQLNPYKWEEEDDGLLPDGRRRKRGKRPSQSQGPKQPPLPPAQEEERIPKSSNNLPPNEEEDESPWWAFE